MHPIASKGSTPRSNQVLLTPKEVAQKLRMSEAWVKDHCTRTKPFLPYVNLGGKKKAVRRFLLDQIEQYITDHMVG